jgi:hypothetical protein
MISPMAAAPAPHSRWLFDPLPDHVLGRGPRHLPLIGSGALLPVSRSSLSVCGELARVFVGMPLCGATLLRIHEPRDDRREVALLAVRATGAICLASVLGLHDVVLCWLLITVYLTWSAWHDTSHRGCHDYAPPQRFLRQREIVITRIVKRALHAPFMLSTHVSRTGAP